MKKIIFFLIIIFSLNIVSFAAFSDVTNYSKQINYLVSKGIINGYKDNTFKPSNEITRAEFAKMIVIATEKTAIGSSYYPDVPSTHWAKEYIDIATSRKLLKGDLEGTFRPEDSITYGEVATVVVRALNKEKEVEKINLNWPLNYLKEAEKLKLFNGYKSNDLVAENNARRDSVALIIYNMLNYEEEKTSETKTDIKIDTKTAFAGIITETTTRNAVPCATVKDENEDEIMLEIATKYGNPSKKSFIIYQLTSNGELKLRNELKISDIDDSFLVAEMVDQEVVKLKNQTKLLDFDLSEYTIGSKTYKLNKMNYFVIEVEDDEFVSYELYAKEDLQLEKNDKIKFDDKLNICYIIRQEQDD